MRWTRACQNWQTASWTLSLRVCVYKKRLVRKTEWKRGRKKLIIRFFGKGRVEERVGGSGVDFKWRIKKKKNRAVKEVTFWDYERKKMITCQRGSQILPKEAAPDKPFCSRLTLEAKHSGVDEMVIAWNIMKELGGGEQHSLIQTSFADTWCSLLKHLTTERIIKKTSGSN